MEHEIENCDKHTTKGITGIFGIILGGVALYFTTNQNFICNPPQPTFSTHQTTKAVPLKKNDAVVPK